MSTVKWGGAQHVTYEDATLYARVELLADHCNAGDFCRSSNVANSFHSKRNCDSNELRV